MNSRARPFQVMAALLLTLANCTLARGETAAAGEGDARLSALVERSWQRELEADPLLATYLGDRRYNDRWTDMSLAALERRRQHDVDTLREVRAISPASISPAQALNYALFTREYQQRVRGWPFKPYLYAINHQGGIQTLHEVTELLEFRTTSDYTNWIKRLEAVGSLIDQHIALLDLAVAERRTQPRVIMERIVPQLALQNVARPEDSPFYAPFKRFPEDFDAASRERLAAAGRAVIGRVVLPAYARFTQAFTERYLPATRASVGIADTPEGADYYAERIAYHTTDETLRAEQIHDIGLAEVQRIRNEMRTIQERVGFKGSLQEFFVFLRTDPQFYYQSSQELFEGYLAVAKRIDPNLVRLFGKLPRTPYGVRPIPATSAPNTTTAYYQGPAADGTRPGYYYVNLYRPEVRPKYEMEVLSVHEAVPGHHLQIALALEQAALPEFRRNAGYTAFIEGWALYSESLGEELGLYQDPYSKFGQLTYDMWRAVRLVVDTGLHAKGWSREQAIDFFKDNAAKTEADIVNEIDRYISWPGQALAYKIGQLHIRTLRREAEAALGARFDLRRFHDAVLEQGAVPLESLSVQVRQWIKAEQAGGR